MNRYRGVVSELHEVKSRLQLVGGESVRQLPAYWADGLRHKDGVN